MRCFPLRTCALLGFAALSGSIANAQTPLSITTRGNDSAQVQRVGFVYRGANRLVSVQDDETTTLEPDDMMPPPVSILPLPGDEGDEGEEPKSRPLNESEVTPGPMADAPSTSEAAQPEKLESPVSPSLDLPPTAYPPDPTGALAPFEHPPATPSESLPEILPETLPPEYDHQPGIILHEHPQPIESPPQYSLEPTPAAPSNGAWDGFFGDAESANGGESFAGEVSEGDATWGSSLQGFCSSCYEPFIQPCVACKQTTVYATADVLYWEKASYDGAPIVRQGGAGGTVVRNGSDLEYDFESGFRTALGVCLDCNSGLEFVFLHNSWDSTLTSAGVGLFTVAGTTDHTAANRVDLATGTDLSSYELNYWLQLSNHTKAFGGIRYLSVDDDLLVTSTTAGRRSTHAIGTDNDLYGLQFGFNSNFPVWNRLSVGGMVKTGLFYNDAAQTVTLRDVNNSVVARQYGNRGDEIAFLSELQVGMTWQVTNFASIRAGYQAFFVSDVASAVGQLRAESPATLTSATLRQDDNLFAHGVFAGLNLCY